jgi:hypothetical protein
MATDCSTDVSVPLNAYLAALPPGAVFASPASACYLVDGGVHITQSLGIVGGQFRDDSSTVPPRLPGRGKSGLSPVIEIKEASGVTIEDVNLVGANSGGGYHADLVGQAGIDVRSGSDITIRNVTTRNTYGDGLTLFLASGAKSGPDSNITVDGLTITNAGRQGITPAYVSRASFNNVTIVSVADNGWDFESDLPAVGTGPMTITNSSWVGGINMIEPITGPITFSHDSGSGKFILKDPGGTQLVSVRDSTLLLPANATGYPPAAILQSGGRLTFLHDVLGRKPSRRPATGPAWLVTGGGQLTIAECSVTGPLGSATGSSRVTIVP